MLLRWRDRHVHVEDAEHGDPASQRPDALRDHDEIPGDQYENQQPKGDAARNFEVSSTVAPYACAVVVLRAVPVREPHYDEDRDLRQRDAEVEMIIVMSPHRQEKGPATRSAPLAARMALR